MFIYLDHHYLPINGYNWILVPRLTSILAPFVVHLQGQGCCTGIPAFIAVHLLPTLQRWI